MDRNPIEKYRRARGLRQLDLAERLGVSDNTIAAWEKGSTPYPARLPKLAEALGVDAVALQDELDRWAATRASSPAAKRTKRRRVDVYPTSRTPAGPSA